MNDETIDKMDALNELNCDTVEKRKCAAEKTTATNMIDLNDDCLDEIFIYLDIPDLIAASETCHRFRDCSVRTFSRMHRKVNVYLHNSSAADRFTTLRILRTFGYMIENILIYFGKNDKDVEFLNIILKKCSSQVKEITFSGIRGRQSSYEFLNKECISRINKKFPNLHSLEFGYFAKSVTDPSCIIEKFPALQHLKIGYSSFTANIIKKFIVLNPQVKQLEITHFSSELLEFINEKLPDLEHFGLWNNNGFIVTNYVYQPLYFHRLKRLHIRDTTGHAGFLPSLAISNQHLEEMTLSLSSCNDFLIESICQYKEITKLQFYFGEHNEMNGSHWQQLAINLLNLAEIEFDGYYNAITDDDIVKFVQASKQLKKLNFRDMRHGDCLIHLYYGNIQKTLDANIWQVTRKYAFQLEIHSIANN